MSPNAHLPGLNQTSPEEHCGHRRQARPKVFMAHTSYGVSSFTQHKLLKTSPTGQFLVKTTTENMCNIVIHQVTSVYNFVPMLKC